MNAANEMKLLLILNWGYMLVFLFLLFLCVCDKSTEFILLAVMGYFMMCVWGIGCVCVFQKSPSDGSSWAEYASIALLDRSTQEILNIVLTRNDYMKYILWISMKPQSVICISIIIKWSSQALSTHVAITGSWKNIKQQNCNIQLQEKVNLLEVSGFLHWLLIKFLWV